MRPKWWRIRTYTWEAAFELGGCRRGQVKVWLRGGHQGGLGLGHVVGYVAAVAPVGDTTCQDVMTEQWHLYHLTVWQLVAFYGEPVLIASDNQLFIRLPTITKCLGNILFQLLVSHPKIVQVIPVITIFRHHHIYECHSCSTPLLICLW